MDSLSDCLLLRKVSFLLDCCEKPLVIIDSSGNISEVNRYFQRLIREYEEDLIGKSIFLYCDEKAGKEIRKVLKHRSLVGPFIFRGNILSNDRNTIATNFTANIIFDDSQEKKEILLSMEPDLPVDFSVENILKFLGEYFLPYVPFVSQIIDSRKKVLYSINWDDLPDPVKSVDSNERFCCYMLKKNKNIRECVCEKTMREGKTFVEEISIDTHLGPVWLVVIVIPIFDSQKRVRAVLSTIDNITDQRRMQKNLEKFLKLTQQESAGTQLSIALARHLKDPLTVISGATEILKERVHQPLLTSVIEKLQKNCEICQLIVNQIFEFKSTTDEELTKIEVNALIRSMVQPAYSARCPKNVVFRYPGPAVYIQCIPRQFAQSLISIINNAVKYADSEVIVDLQIKGNNAVISIMDDGPGVPEEIRAKIFEPFFTTDDSSSILGLGLTLTKAIIESMGGTIEVREGELGGANFVITVPLYQDPIEREGESKHTKKSRLLIVEDEQDLQQLIIISLNKLDIEIVSAYTTDEAVRLLDTETFDSVILDIQLPGSITGYQLYDYLRKGKKYPSHKIILITADSMNLSTQQFLQRAKSPCLEKPFQFEVLKNCIESSLSK